MTEPTPTFRPPDLLIIGLDRSGSTALAHAHDSGASVLGVDAGAAPEDGVAPDARYGTRVWGLYPDGTVAMSSAHGTDTFVPRGVIIATGAIDIPLAIPGWHLPGVIGAVRARRELAPGTVVVVLRGPHAGTGGRRVNLDPFTVLHDITLDGNADARIERHGDVLRVVASGEVVDAPTVLLDNGLQTENALARMAGIPTTFSVDAGGDVIPPGAVFATGGTLVSVIGDAAGIGPRDDARLAEAAEAASRLTRSFGGGGIPRSIDHARPPWPKEGTPTLPACTTDDTLVCPDEGVTVGDVREAIRRGATTVNDVKRRTRAAMAACQGRDCLWTIRALLAEAGRDFTTPMTARAPVTGITLVELASLADTRPRDAVLS